MIGVVETPTGTVMLMLVPHPENDTAWAYRIIDGDGDREHTFLDIGTKGEAIDTLVFLGLPIDAAVVVVDDYYDRLPKCDCCGLLDVDALIAGYETVIETVTEHRRGEHQEGEPT